MGHLHLDPPQVGRPGTGVADNGGLIQCQLGHVLARYPE